MNAILTVNSISKTFKLSKKQQKREHTTAQSKVAVDDLSFTAYEGEVFGLLGPNGAGKTTTLRILATLIKSDAGDAFVDGLSVRRQPHQVRRKIGFLSGDLKLEEFFAPAYLFDFFAALHGTPPGEVQARREALFSRFGIDEFAGEKVSTLSTGMKQKASIAVSIAHDPEIIIFDEPTNGLDIIAAKAVTDFLLELRTQGKTIILSTHIFSLVEKLCDRVGVIMNGKMIRCDTLGNMCAEKSLEDTFFDLYDQIRTGDAA
jgi:sodium transport system ATP-binding protein